MIKKIFSHTFIYGITPYITSIASLFALPIITQDLTPKDFGIWGIIGAYVGLLGGVATLGLTMHLSNSFFKYPVRYKVIWKEVYGLLTVWNFIYAFILVILLSFVIPEQASNNKGLILILITLPIVLFGPVSSIGQLYYQLNRLPVQIMVRSIVLGFIGIGLNVYFIAHLKLGYMGWFWSTCIIGIILNISYWYPINVNAKIKPVFRFKKRRIIRLLKTSIPTIPHYYSSYLVNGATKVAMERLHVPISDIGNFNVANNFSDYAGNIASASNLAIGPILLKLYSKGEFTLARNLVFLWESILLLLTFLLCIWMKEIFNLLIKNPELNYAYPMAIIMIMAYNFRPMYVGCNQTRFFFEKTNKLIAISFTAGIISIILNIILIPILGFKIVPFVFFISLMYWGYSGYFFKDFKELNKANFYPLFWLTLTVIITITAHYFVELKVLIKAVLSVVLLISAFLIYQFRLKTYYELIDI